MPPTRRYLRISPHSVLEVRIYLDNPADAHRWLLQERDAALPRVIEAVKPLVLPKLREENERARGKGGKSGKGLKGKGKGIKDVVVRGEHSTSCDSGPCRLMLVCSDDFDVSIFLTELSTPHSILTRQKVFKADKDRIKSNSEKMIGTIEDPMEIDDDIGIRAESEDEGKSRLHEIPTARGNSNAAYEEEGQTHAPEALFLSEDSEDSASGKGLQTQQATTSRGKQEQRVESEAKEDHTTSDNKKKMAVKTTYDGFRIYGRILCLVVKRKGIPKRKQVLHGAGQAMMEDWITSTQLAQGQMLDD